MPFSSFRVRLAAKEFQSLVGYSPTADVDKNRGIRRKGRPLDATDTLMLLQYLSFACEVVKKVR